MTEQGLKASLTSGKPQEIAASMKELDMLLKEIFSIDEVLDGAAKKLFAEQRGLRLKGNQMLAT